MAHVLSLSTVFPRPDEPSLGLFVERRLQHLAQLLPLRVVAPVPWLDTAGAIPRVPRLNGGTERTLGALRVSHPRWAYPPGAGAFHPYWLAASLYPVLKRIRSEFPFDLIDAHFAYPEGAAAGRLARRFGCAYSVTLRGNEPMHAAAPVKRRQIAAALQRASAVIAVSRPLLDFALSLGAAPDRATVIPNGVDSAIFHPGDRAAVRAALGMDPSRLHILSAGYLIPRKGHHRLLPVLSHFHSAGLPADLWIVGDAGREGNSSPEIRRLIASLGLEPFVHLVPAVPPETLASYMCACDLFCLASSREGWPNVVHEALACGAPVVATDVGGVPDMIPSRAFGRVVPQNDDSALASAILDALRSPFDRAAIARHAAARSWSNVAAEVAGLFDRALAAGIPEVNPI